MWAKGEIPMKKLLSLVTTFAMLSAMCANCVTASAQATDWEKFLAENTQGETVLDVNSFENGEWKLLSDDGYDLTTSSGDKTYLDLIAHYYDTAPEKTENVWTGLDGTTRGENSVTVGDTVKWKRNIPASSNRKKASYYIADDAFKSGSDKTLTKIHIAKAFDKTYSDGKIAVLFNAALENGNSGLHIKSISDADFFNRYQKNNYTPVVSDGSYHDFVCLVDLDNTVCDVYVDGTKTATVSGSDIKNEISDISFAATGRTGGNQNDATITSVKVIYFPDLGKEIAEKLTFDMISNGQKQACVTEDLNLITSFTYDNKTVNVSWKSSDECINAENGTVTRGTRGKAVALTATIGGTGINTEKSFDVFVPAYGNVLLVEDFESIEEGKSIATSTTEGENGWLLDSNNYDKATAEGDELAVEKDSLNKTNTLKIVRKVAGTDNKTNVNFNTLKSHTAVKGIISYRYKIYGNNASILLRAPLTSNLAGTQMKFADKNSTVLAFKNSVNIYDKQWHEMYYEFNTESLGVDFYIDGESMGTVTLSSIPDCDRVLLGMQRSKSGTVKIDDIVVTLHKSNSSFDKLLEQEQKTAAEVFNAIFVGQQPSCVTENLAPITALTLGGKEFDVAWSSSDDGALYLDAQNPTVGIVSRGDFDKKVVLTATVTAKDNPADKSTIKFDILIPAMGDVLFFEDFESIEEGKSLATSTTSGENGWLLQSDNYDKAVAEGDKLVVENDAQNGTKALSVVRIVSGTDNSVNINFNVQKYFETVKCLIAYRYKIYGDNTSILLRAPLTSNLANSQIKFGDEKSTVLAFKNSSGKTVEIFDKQWHELYYTFDYNTLEVDFYIDGESVGKTTLSSLPDNNIVLFGMQRARLGTVKIDDVLVTRPDYNTKLDIKKALDTIKNDLESNTFEEAVTISNIGILNTSAEYEVVSGNVTVADSQLKFERLLGSDQNAVIKVTVSRNGFSESENISVTIPAYTQAEYDVKDFDFTSFAPNERQDLVENNVSLPTTYNGYTLVWSSSDENSLNSQTGVVNRGLYDVPLTLSVSFQKDGAEAAKKQFDIVVAAAGSIIGSDSFDVAAEAGTDIADCTQWKIDGVELATADVYYKAAKNMYDGTDGVLKVERHYLRSSGQSPSAQVAYRTIAQKCERLALTFDIMFEDEVSTASFKLFNTDGNTINELFEMTTKYIMQKSFKNTKTTFKTPLELQKWYRVQIVFDAYKDTYDIFVDYEKINDAPFVAEGLGGTPNAVGFYSDSFSTVYDKFYIDNVMVRDLTPDTATALALAKEALEISYSADTTRITLPKTGEQNTAVSWKSSNPAAVAADGTVARKLGQEQAVTLTATITKSDKSVTKEFALTIPALDAYATPTAELMQKIADEITFSLISDEHRLAITENLTFISEYNRATAATVGGVDIAWSCPLSNVISTDGTVKRQKYDVRTVLTAVIASKENPEMKFEKQFSVTVVSRGKTVRQYDFEDTASSQFGEAMANRTDFSNKVVVPGRDYGMQFFIDRLYDTRKDDINPSENALYLRRYINHADVRSDCYLKMEKETGAGSMYDDPSLYETCDLSAVGFKFMLESGSDIRFQYTDISTSQIRIELTRLVYPDLTVTFDEPLSTDAWHEFELVTDNLLKTSDFYLDGKKLNAIPVSMPSTKGYVNEVRFYNKNGQGNILVDDLTVRYLSKNCDEYVQADKSALSIPAMITGNVELPLTGNNNSRIKWVSSDKSILTENGKALSDGSVTLTAYIMQGNSVDTKAFTVSVKTAQQKVTINSARVENSALALNADGVLSDGTYCVKLYHKGSVVKILTAPYSETTDITIPTSCKYDSLTVYVRDKDKNNVSPLMKIER